MKKCLEDVLAVLALRGYRRLRAKYRNARAAARRQRAKLEAALIEQRQREQELQTRLAESDNDRALLTSELQQMQARLDQANAEIEILEARDKMWLAWETRERARLEAETATQAAVKVRAVDYPNMRED